MGVAYRRGWGAVVFAACVAAAVAAPHQGTSEANVPVKKCAPGQTRKQCQDANVAAACAGKTGDACAEALKPAYKARYDALPNRLVFKPTDKVRDSDGLVPGKHSTYTPASVNPDSITPGSFLAWREKDRAKAIRSTGEPLNYSAHPDYTGGSVASC